VPGKQLFSIYVAAASVLCAQLPGPGPGASYRV